jgi:hypothetical protein
MIDLGLISIQPFTFISIIVTISILWLVVFKLKNWKWKAAAIALWVVMIISRPIVFKQDDMSDYEAMNRGWSTDIADIVVGVPPNNDFDQKQVERLNELREQNREYMNDEQNF